MVTVPSVRIPDSTVAAAHELRRKIAAQMRRSTDPVTCMTIELKPSGKATEMRFHHALFADKQGRNNHMAGWKGSFDKLAAHCKGKALN